MPKAGMPTRRDNARADAVARFTEAKKANAAVWEELAKRHDAEGEKIARLRALRLEKEAADKAVAEAAAAVAKPAPRSKRPRVTAPKPEDGN